MPSSFQLLGLSPEAFEPLFSLSDAQLAERGAQRRFADESPGYPCRVSLNDAALGDEMLLLPFVHQPADSPYRASGPIFVRRGVAQAALAPDVVPPYVTRRLISLRVYDAAHMMIAAAVHEGPDVARALALAFDDPRAGDVHLHNARQGCFSCRAVRAGDA